MVAKIAIYHRSEPRSLITNRLMHSLSEFGFDLMELFRKSHPHRCSLYHELSIPADTAVMRESQKVEGLRLAPSVYALAVLRRKAPKSVASFPHLEHLNKLPSEKSIHIVIFPCSVSSPLSFFSTATPTSMLPQIRIRSLVCMVPLFFNIIPLPIHCKKEPIKS